ncbi:MAG: EAL domain-containing protein [Actinobacteria bacterium]|nr:MAG: EAL domain-containing protein [Actinomycetota bacterium]
MSAVPVAFRGSDDDRPTPDEVARRYRTLIEQLPLVVYVDELDAVSSNIFTSRQIEPLLGYSVEEWASEADLFSRLLHPDDRDRVLASHAHTQETHEPLSLEYRLIARDGRVVWLRDEGVVVLDEHGQPLHLQGYLLDITREREAEIQLRQLALYDPLTGLANRAFFHERLRHAVMLRHDDEHGTGLLYIDLDDFKGINDRWGHDLGDDVLHEIGRRIEQSVRPGDTAARLGGDEFAVVLTEPVTPEDAVGVAERLLEEIGKPLESGSGALYTSASIGIAFGSDDETLLKEADIAMYRAKGHPEIGYAFFEPKLDRVAVERSQRIAELREGIVRGEFRLDYQAVVDLDQYEIIGYEALVRWEHPTAGELPPGEFIPLAEETGLIVGLGEWVLTEACTEATRLCRLHGRPMHMSVNVSARQLHHPDFLRHVHRALDSSALLPSLLTLELTESTLLASDERVAQTLQTIKELGVVLALDDFGTGYASLSYLRQFPIDVVKIDRSFTANVASEDGDLVLLKGIIDLGHALELNLVAEGIETSQQHTIVRKLGCQQAQGFYFGRPSHPAQRDLDAVSPV